MKRFNNKGNVKPKERTLELAIPQTKALQTINIQFSVTMIISSSGHEYAVYVRDFLWLGVTRLMS